MKLKMSEKLHLIFSLSIYISHNMNEIFTINININKINKILTMNVIIL